MSNNPLTGFKWSQWLYGLWAAVIGGGSTAAYGALSLVIIDPKDFNPQTAKFYQIAGMMFGFGALSHFFAYLKEHPAPELVSSERKEEHVRISQVATGSGDGQATKTVTTKVEEKVEIATAPVKDEGK